MIYLFMSLCVVAVGSTLGYYLDKWGVHVAYVWAEGALTAIIAMIIAMEGK